MFSVTCFLWFVLVDGENQEIVSKRKWWVLKIDLKEDQDQMMIDD